MHTALAEFARRYDLPAGALDDLKVAVSNHIAGRYVDLGPIAAGGMGSVRRVRDRELNRTLAMKIIHPDLLESPLGTARFLEEAQATAQLQHPNIIPIHDLGRLPDGRLWYTMKEVRGRTLSDVVQEVHAASPHSWSPSASGWTLRRVMTAYLAVCHGVAHAHERGVVHRDLKPDNVMVGEHGETYVLDWGLAKVLGRSVLPTEAPDVEVVATERSQTDSESTMFGAVAGTPSYMSPEQARGEHDKIDARSDVYALGAILFEVLAGIAPYHESDDVLARVISEPPPRMRPAAPTFDGLGGGSTEAGDDGLVLEPDGSGPPLPDELVEACTRAMQRKPSARYETATELAAVVQAWLDGSRRRDHALGVCEAALAGVDESRVLQERAAGLQAEGDELLQGVEPWRPEADKAEGWARQDRAAELRLQAELKQLEVDQGLHGALRVEPTLPEAHAALTERYRERHVVAEARREADLVARASRLMRLHADALPAAHETRQRCAAFLKGDGALTLVTDPPGAQVRLYRYETRNRRLVEVFQRSLGTTPIANVPLPMGSYVCTLVHPDHDEVRYPIEVARQGHWDGVAPGDTQPTSLWLPPRGTFAPDEVYIPAGWFRSGGDPNTPWSGPARRLWCDALVAKRFPVTNRQYLRFLDDLVAEGRVEEALRHAPRERSGKAGEQGALIYGFDGTRFSLQVDADGDAWQPDWPVLQVDWFGASAYLAWLAEREGCRWRLPLELEWEKAARGVDGRFYPWGDRLDPSWCLMTHSHQGARLPADVDSYPVDVSPHGARGVGGNVRDWCQDLFEAGGDAVDGERVMPGGPSVVGTASGQRVLRGGYWLGAAITARLAYRVRAEPTYRSSDVGFRGVCRLSFESGGPAR